MDTPTPRPRSVVCNDASKRPVPLPRAKCAQTSRQQDSGEGAACTPAQHSSPSDLFRSLGSVSRQISDDIAQRVQSSGRYVVETTRCANDKIEKSIADGTKVARDSIEKTIHSTKLAKDHVTKSVIEGTRNATLRLKNVRKGSSKETVSSNRTQPRCVSMPVTDVSFFGSIQFHSPLVDQKNNNDESLQSSPTVIVDNIRLNSQSSAAVDYRLTQCDDTYSEISNYSYTETMSNLSFDSNEHPTNVVNVQHSLRNDLSVTYDTPKEVRMSFSERSLSNNSSLTTDLPGEASDASIEFRNDWIPNAIPRNNLVKKNSYENWSLSPEPLLEKEPTYRPSKSTICEFDPLVAMDANNDGKSNELLLLEAFLMGDTYGTVPHSNLNKSLEDLSDESYFMPPTPPERSDSLFLEDSEDAIETSSITSSVQKSESNSSWFVSPGNDNKNNNDVQTRTKGNGSVMRRFSNILRLDSVLNLKSKSGCQLNLPTVLQPPAVLVAAGNHHSGTMTRITSGGVEDLFKNSVSRFCVLASSQLTCYPDSTNMTAKEIFLLKHLYSLQIMFPQTISSSGNLYCFEINMSGTLKGSSRKVLFNCSNASERRTWAQHIVEHLTNGFPAKYSAEFTRVGWCYLKESVTGAWHSAWIMLIRRVLVYFTTNDSTVRTVDLRKARCVVTQDADERTKEVCPGEGSPNLLLDCPHLTLYLRMPVDRELKAWRNIIILAAHNNGYHLHHQQLTKDDVPTIVDKCINFVYAHGSMSEGIYRRAGTNIAIAELLTSFRKDAWSVQITKQSHTEHDIAGTVKRFFRDLPEPLITVDLHNKLLEAHEISDIDERNAVYKCLLDELTVVARKTARKLFAHLHFIHTLHSINKMTAENLASVWGPTLMPATVVTCDTLQTAWSQKEVAVICDLIKNYPKIYQPTSAELEREQTMLRVLQRVTATSACAPQKQSGDIRIWVYLGEKENGKCENIAVTPNKTCADLCIELCSKIGLESHLVMMEEVICNDSMRRFIHLDEIVLSVILRWGYWDEEDRKDNYLLLRENKPLQEIDNLRASTSLVCGELKFANDRSKTFKQYMFDLQNSKLAYYKDKQGSNKIGEWRIEDILWYVGHESKRNPHTHWSITFIPRNKQKRSKDRPWFGCTIAGSITEDLLKWMTAMMVAEHGSTILPTPRLIIP